MNNAVNDALTSVLEVVKFSLTNEQIEELSTILSDLFEMGVALAQSETDLYGNNW